MIARIGIIIGAALLAFAGLAVSGIAAEPQLPLRTVLAQKIMLDLRYYCEQPVPAGSCRNGMTELPVELAHLIRETEVGGVIHFMENLQSAAQIQQLNHDLQQAASSSRFGLPLFIAVDQEGGRVARLPKHEATTFSGNMAIGATYAEHGIRFANSVGHILAKELLALGFNVNFAPTVDVNNNPDNPVINVRSFGDDPARVAELGGAMVAAMERQGLQTALKHFPGHGDTVVDSHLGLPQVKHDMERIEQIELKPFADIIRQQQPSMMMTAHIQFPELDASSLTARDGRSIIKPATLSRAILTDLLRTQLGYQGVIVTDALDMAGISQFFSPEEAVIHAFAAGADIALMPLKVQSPAELGKLSQLLDALEQAVADGRLQEKELRQSNQRIQALKQRWPDMPARSLVTEVLGHPLHRAEELALARASITLVKNSQQILPLAMDGSKKLLILMPDSSRCQAMEYALQQVVAKKVSYQCLSLLQPDWSSAETILAAADVVIGAFISPMQSLAEMGGMDDIAALGGLQQAYRLQQQRLQQALAGAQQRQQQVIYLSLRSPYDVVTFGDYAAAVLASYDYHTVQDPSTGQHRGVAFQALAEVLFGKQEATGQLPVKLLKNGN